MKQDTSAFRSILGGSFFVGLPEEAVALGLRGGLVVVPSAPVLATLDRDVSYRDALVNADLTITDSGLMVLVWWLIAGERVRRVSGLEYLRALMLAPETRAPRSVLWVMPSEAARDRTLDWLQKGGIDATREDFYVAPLYRKGSVEDHELLQFVRRHRPRHIIIGLGGGTQEPLGLFLKQRLDYSPGIHCIGAALGFLNGDQVGIPTWADRLFLGWLFRCLSQPAKFVPRYWRAIRLVSLMWRYRDRLPELAR